MSRQTRVSARPRSRLVAPRHYAVARHRELGQIWAFQFAGDALLAVCGPLDEVPPASLLPRLDYGDPWARLDVGVIRERLHEFDRVA